MDVLRFADENSFAAPALQGKRAVGGGLGGIQQKSAGLGAKSQGSSVRRALGDISNRAKGASDQPLQAAKREGREIEGQQRAQQGGASCAPVAPVQASFAAAGPAGPSEREDSLDLGSPERFGRNAHELAAQEAEAAINAAVENVLSLRGTLPDDCYAEKPQARSSIFSHTLFPFAARSAGNQCHALTLSRRHCPRSARRYKDSSTTTPSTARRLCRPHRSRRQVRPCTHAVPPTGRAKSAPAPLRAADTRRFSLAASSGRASLAALLPDLDGAPDIQGMWSIDEGGDSVLDFP